MPKKLGYEATFQCSLQRFMDVLYGSDDSFYRGYHSHINKDPNATIGEWDASHTRVITFVPNVPLPAVAKRAIGLEGSGVKVQEKQQLNYQPEQRRAVLTSASNPMVKGGERFMTRMQVTYTEGADGNVRAGIEIEIEVMVWGMAAMLEGFMVDTAGGAFTEFMEFTHAYLRGDIAAPRPGPPPSVYAPSEVDEFFDFDTMELAEAEHQGPSVTVSSWFMQTVMQDLSELRSTTAAMRSLAVASEQHTQQLLVEVALLRAQARRTNVYSTLQMLALLGGASYVAYPALRLYVETLRRRT